MLAEVGAKTVAKTLGNVKAEFMDKIIADTLTCVEDKKLGQNRRLY